MDLRNVVQQCVDDLANGDDATLAARERVIAAGNRLVDFHPTPTGAMNVYDAVTGEHVFTGPTEAAGEVLDQDGVVPLSAVEDQVTYPTTPIPDVPAELAHAIRGWVETHYEEARRFAGASAPA